MAAIQINGNPCLNGCLKSSRAALHSGPYGCPQFHHIGLVHIYISNRHRNVTMDVTRIHETMKKAKSRECFYILVCMLSDWVTNVSPPQPPKWLPVGPTSCPLQEMHLWSIYFCSDKQYTVQTRNMSIHDHIEGFVGGGAKFVYSDF